MVYSFLICNSEENGKLCYWEPYTCLGDKGKTSEELQSHEAKNIDLIINRVNEELKFQKEMKYTLHGERNKQELEPMSGKLSLPKEQINCEFGCNVIWETCFKCCFILAIEKNENVALAENILKLLMRYATNVFNMVEENAKQIHVYPDKMSAILHIFLPGGRLVFMNHRIVKQFEKDLDKILSERK